MTLVVLPEGVQKSGSGSGIVWSHNRYGAYTRNRTVPVNPNTLRQSTVRGIVTSLTIAWQNTLTQLQRDAWEVYAANVTWKNKLGQAVFLTGFNHYVRTNTSRLQAKTLAGALLRIDDAPTIFNLATPELALNATPSEATQTVVVTYDDTAPWTTDTTAYQSVFVGLPQNPSINFFGGPYRFAGVIDAAIPPTSPENVSSPFPFVEGQKIWTRTRIERGDGRLSEFALSVVLAIA